MVAKQPQHFSWTSPSETSHPPSDLGTGCSRCCLHRVHVCSWVATLAAMRFAAPPVAVVLGGLVLRMGMPGQEGFPRSVLRWWRWFLQHCAAGAGSSGWIARALGAPGRCAQTDPVPLLPGFWPRPALVVQSPGASDSTCCQRSGAVRVRQPQVFALSPALPAACPVLRSAAPAPPLKPSPNKREVQPEQGGQRLALTAPRSDGGALQPAASRFPPCSHCPSPPQASVSGLDLEASAAPQRQGLPPGVRHPGAASWKAPAPTASLQRELSSFFSPLERVAGQLPGLRGST